MIVCKYWKTQDKVKRGVWTYDQIKTWQGYFLFGFLPLFIKMVDLTEERR